MKKESKEANSSKERKDSFVKLSSFVFEKFVNTNVDSFSNGILVNRDSMSKLVKKCVHSKKDFLYKWRLILYSINV